MNPIKSLKNILKSIKSVLSTLFREPMTLKFPDESLKPVKNYRGKHLLHPERCIDCGLCVKICPNEAIEIVDFDGGRAPQIHLGKCCFCGLCEEKCPTKAITMTPEAMISITDKSSAVYGPDKLSQLSKEKQKEDSLS